jgi:hypothetical protein
VDNSGADITDYFNYGFNEDTWRAYAAKQAQLRMEQQLGLFSTPNTQLPVGGSKIAVFFSFLCYFNLTKQNTREPIKQTIAAKELEFVLKHILTCRFMNQKLTETRPLRINEVKRVCCFFDSLCSVS